MSYVKCGKRTFRVSAPQFCSNCGTQVYYWAHDTESLGVTGAHFCAEHSSYSWVYLNRDSSTHYCDGEFVPRYYLGRDPKGKPDTDDNEPEQAPASVAAINAAMAAGAQVKANGHGSADLDRVKAVQVLMDALTPKATVDPDTVRAIVREELGAIGALPFTVEVSDPATGAVTPVKGAANRALPDIIDIAKSGLNPMMVGPMGTGKSFIAKQVAQALNVEIREISLTPQTSKSDLFGYMSANGTYVPSALYDWWVNPNGGVFHFDEFDNGHASIMAGVNAIVAKLQDGPDAAFDFPCGRVTRGGGRKVAVASANTYGRGPDRQYLRQQLDAATVDRFEMVPVEYDELLERSVCMATGLDKWKVDATLKYVRHLRRAAEAKRMPLPFGMRRSHAVSALLANGMKPSKAVAYSVRRGISDDDWATVNAGAPEFIKD